MKTGFIGLRAAALLSAFLLIGAVPTAQDATAQRGRAEAGQKASESRVERRVQKKTKEARKTPANRVKTDQRQRTAKRERAVNRNTTARTVDRVRETKRSDRGGNDRARIENRKRDSRDVKTVARAKTRPAFDRNQERRSGEVGRDDRGTRSSSRVRDGRTRGDVRSGEGTRSARDRSLKRDSYDRRGDRDRDGNRKGRIGNTDTRYRSGSGRVRGSRSRYDGRDRRHHRPVVVPHKHKRTYGKYYRHNRAHKHEYAWCNVYHPAGHHHYVNAHVHIGSHISIGVAWPWKVRYQRHWRPRYRYRQVVYVDAGWGGRRRDARVDVRTYYRHRVLHADDRFAEVEVEIDAIELYQNDRYLGTVDRIPGSLKKIRATIGSDGRIDFDRDVFLIGDAWSGFELISTRHYNDYLYNAYDDRHGYRVGRVDLRSGKVKKARRSRLFNYRNFNGFVPISLLPDDDRMWDYGRPYLEESSYYYDDEDNGWYSRYRDYDDDGYELSRDLDVSYTTPQGAQVRFQRSSRLERLD